MELVFEKLGRQPGAAKSPPPEAMEFILAFDDGKPAKPFVFEVNFDEADFD